ncbi:Rap1a/Tai family immunity protein [Rhodoferax sp.]|uniref:Rap1a/Tai family immunity protein n=1 Tax=Rhodoferax sp. TaxID=50421 RepID=UPI0025E73266|nr:Rap1a/Tai family immunity protein [Rhodoferax sp.]
MRTTPHTPNNLSLLRQAAAMFALCLAAASTAQAMTIREMRALEKTEKQGSTYTDYYLVGVMEGALEAHAQAVRAGAPASICLNGRRLEPSMAKNIYTSELKRNADLYEADFPVQLVVVNALGTVYPCL